MTTYSVHKTDGNDQVVIALEGYGPTNGFTEVGTFEHGVNEENSQTDPDALTASNGDHVFIAKAKELLADSKEFGHLNLDKLTFLDRASNAPLHDEDLTSTDDLSVSEEGADPNTSSQAGGEQSVVNTDPATTEANGVQQVPSEVDGEVDASDNQEVSETTEDQGTEEVEDINEVDTLDNPDTNDTSDTNNNRFDPSDMTVDDLKDYIEKIDDKVELNRIYELEKAGKERGTALKAIENRADELA